MIKLIVSTILLVAFADALSIKNCKSSSPVQLSVSKFPDPLYLRKGQKLVISGKAVVRTQAPDRLKIKLKIQKKMWFWVTLPCVKEIGSCTYDVNCDQIRQIGYKGKCPVGPGTHELKDFTVVLPEINVPSFLTNGYYFLEADIRDGYTGKQLACGSLYITVKS